MSDYQFNPNVEQWKAIPDYPGYDVSDHGRVRSFWKFSKNSWEGSKYILESSSQRFLKPGVVKGYFKVSLYNGKSKQYNVHRLVLLVFIGPCPQGHIGCHNNGNPMDNILPNLRWDTHKSNHIDRINHGNGFFGEDNPNAKLTTKQVAKIIELASQGKLHSELARMFGVSQTHIIRIVKRMAWKCIL